METCAKVGFNLCFSLQLIVFAFPKEQIGVSWFVKSLKVKYLELKLQAFSN